MIIVATTSLPAVDLPNADRLNAAYLCQNKFFGSSSFLGVIYIFGVINVGKRNCPPYDSFCIGYNKTGIRSCCYEVIQNPSMVNTFNVIIHVQIKVLKKISLHIPSLNFGESLSLKIHIT